MKQFIYLAILVFGVNLMICAGQEDKTVQPVQTWSGKEVDNRLLEAAPKSGYVSNEADWIKMWKAWRKDEAPKIDFSKNLIVFCTTQTPNSCGVNLKLSESGDLKIINVSTLIGSDAKTFNYQIALIDRAGIKSIEGKPIASSDMATNKSPNNNLVKQLKQAMQELLDAIAPGKREVWEKYLAEGGIYADEEGRVLTKGELLKELTPLPNGYIGSIKMGNRKF